MKRTFLISYLAVLPLLAAEPSVDFDWIRVEKETEANGKLRSGVTAYKLTPADFSALK